MISSERHGILPYGTVALSDRKLFSGLFSLIRGFKFERTVPYLKWHSNDAWHCRCFLSLLSLLSLLAVYLSWLI